MVTSQHKPQKQKNLTQPSNYTILIYKPAPGHSHSQIPTLQYRHKYLFGSLGHGVKGGTVLEPLDLAYYLQLASIYKFTIPKQKLTLVEGVDELDVEGLAVLGLDGHSHGLANSELSALEVDLGIEGDLVVVLWVLEGERKETLLLQVGLVDTSEGAGDDGKTTKMAGFESSVLTGRTLSVVPVTNNNPLNTLGLVVTGNIRDSATLTSKLVSNVVGLAVLSVDGTNQHVVGDVVEMATVLEPRTSHRDVVSGGLALALDEDGDIGGILAVPGVEGREDLETVRGRGDLDLDRGSILGRSLVGVTSGIVATLRKTSTGGRLELELRTIGSLKLVGHRVEAEVTSNGHSGDNIRRSDEGVGGRVGIVTSGEVTVVRRDDGVGLTLLDILTIPLTNAGSASVGKDDTSELLKSLELTVTLNGGANLLGTRSNSVDGLGLDTVVQGIASDGGRAGHILIRGVGARADETDLELSGPAVLLNSLLELRERGGKIRGERTVDVGLKLAEVDLNELVVLSTLILLEVLGVGAGVVTDVSTLGGRKVVVHTVVEGEDGGGGTNFSTHVANSTHTSGGQRVDTRTVVFNDGTSSTLDGEDTSNLQDNVCVPSDMVTVNVARDTNP